MIGNMNAGQFKRSLFILLVWGGVVSLFVIGAYFATRTGGTISLSNNTWGQFGDYVGGLLNPLFGFLAFLALLLTISLQIDEFDHARQAARETLRVASKQSEVVTAQLKHMGRIQVLADLKEAIVMQANEVDELLPVLVFGNLTTRDLLRRVRITIEKGEDPREVYADGWLYELRQYAEMLALKLEQFGWMLESYDTTQMEDSAIRGHSRYYTNSWRFKYDTIADDLQIAAAAGLIELTSNDLGELFAAQVDMHITVNQGAEEPDREPPATD